IATVSSSRVPTHHLELITVTDTCGACPLQAGNACARACEQQPHDLRIGRLQLTDESVKPTHHSWSRPGFRLPEITVLVGPAKTNVVLRLWDLGQYKEEG